MPALEQEHALRQPAPYKLDISQLVALRDGDNKAWGHFVINTKPALLATCQRLGMPYSRIDDLISDAYLKFLNRLHPRSDESDYENRLTTMGNSPRQLLKKMVKNGWIDEIRQWNRFQKYGESMIRAGVICEETHYDDTELIEDRIQDPTASIRTKLQMLFDSNLNTRYKEVIHHLMNGDSNELIREKMGIESRTTGNVVIFRAREAAKKLFGADQDSAA